MEAASSWLVGPGQQAADCRIPGGSRASAGSPVGGVTVQKSLGLLPAHRWVNPGLGVSASLLVGRARSWGLVAGPRGPRAGVGSLVGGASSDTVGYRVQGVLKFVLAF